MSSHCTSSAPSIFIFALFILSPFLLFAQTQTIRGTVIDAHTLRPIEAVAVQVEGTARGALTDSAGAFKIEGIPVGRVRVKCTYLGYTPYFSDYIFLNSARGQVLEIQMAEDVDESLDEVLITAQEHPKKALNDLAVVSARSFSAEETKLYAASVNDPGRMATSFAGVQVGTNEDENDILIRGNSSFGVLWRLEGIDIPNPNHFARPGTSGGGITVFSAQLLATSDFMAGAMPAEYGNAISGAFDMHFRKGNMDEQDHRIKLSLLGLDFSTEGPIKKGRSSYLLNYRFSTLTLLNKMGFELVGENIENNFQDFSFNLAFNGKNQRSFWTVFGISGLSAELYLPREDTAQWESPSHWTDRVERADMAAAGVTFRYLIDDKSYIKAVVAGMGGFIDRTRDTLTTLKVPSRINTEEYFDRRISASLTYQRKFSLRTRLKIGTHASQIFYRFSRNRTPLGTQQFSVLVDGEGSTQLLQGYAQLSHKASQRLTLNVGVHAILFALNNTTSLEPRLSLQYKVNRRHTVAAAYGLHGQVLPMGTYFAVLTDDQGVASQPNMNLPLVKSHHAVLSYNAILGQQFRLRTEVYYQWLFNVPIRPDINETYWMLNNQSGFAEWALVSEGTGENYGLDVAVEKFFSKGYYLLLTGSTYSSTYKALDGVRYNSRFNTRFSSSLTTGREFAIKGKNVLQGGLRAMLNGGFRYTPADPARSAMEGRFVPIPTFSYRDQVEPYFRLDGRIAYRINGKKSASIISLDIQNVLNRKNTTRLDYNPATNEFFLRTQGEILPVLGYQVDF